MALGWGMTKRLIVSYFRNICTLDFRCYCHLPFRGWRLALFSQVCIAWSFFIRCANLLRLSLHYVWGFKLRFDRQLLFRDFLGHRAICLRICHFLCLRSSYRFRRGHHRSCHGRGMHDHRILHLAKVHSLDLRVKGQLLLGQIEHLLVNQKHLVLELHHCERLVIHGVCYEWHGLIPCAGKQHRELIYGVQWIH